MSARVTVYVRPGCHLCDQALAALEPLRSAQPFELEIIDIERDPLLHARYLERIPVIALDGVERYDFFLDAEDLRSRLAAG